MPNVRDHDASVYLRLQGDALSVGGYEANPIFWEEVRAPPRVPRWKNRGALAPPTPSASESWHSGTQKLGWDYCPPQHEAFKDLSLWSAGSKDGPSETLPCPSPGPQ